VFADELKFAMRRRGGMTAALWTNRRILVCDCSRVGVAIDFSSSANVRFALYGGVSRVSQFFAVAQRVTQPVDIGHNLSATIAHKRVPAFGGPQRMLETKLLLLS
jgi:hypothetical protein